MRKSIKFMALPLLILAMFTTTFANTGAKHIPGVVINNTKLSTNAVNKEGRVLVPLRAIFDGLGATMNYDHKTKTITGSQDNPVRIMTLVVGDSKATVGGVEVILDVPAQLINDVTFVPVRFIGENFGAEVDWYRNNVLINTDRDWDGLISNGDKVSDETSKREDPKETDSNTGDLSKDKYKVVRVVDGDTIIVNFGGTEERVRLIGIDTPESVHPTASKNTKEGKIASDYLTRLLDGKRVGLEFDVQQRDQYGRLLAYVYIDDDVMVNQILLINGYARIATFPPNVKYVDELTQIQKIAIDAKSGFWANSFETTPINPIDEKPLEVESVTSNDKAEDTKVMGSIKSDKFHSMTCKHAKNIKNDNALHFNSIEDAVQAGYTPCGVCKPN